MASSRTADEVQAQIDSLRKAIGAGVLIVQHGTDRVQYQTIGDMRKALQLLLAELDSINGTSRSRVNYIKQKSKGYGHGPGFGSFIGKDFSEFD